MVDETELKSLKSVDGDGVAVNLELIFVDVEDGKYIGAGVCSDTTEYGVFILGFGLL